MANATSIKDSSGTNGKIYHRCFDTGDKFATGAVDFWISLQLFEKLCNDPNVIFRGMGEDDSWKNPEAKNLVTLSL